MGKVLSRFIILFVILLMFPCTARGAEVYYGRVGVRTEVSQLVFRDLDSHWARSSVYRLAAVGVIRAGGPYFRPDGRVTKEEALGMIIRLAGKEGEAQKLEAGPGDAAAYRSAWGANYTRFAQAQGVISAQERANTDWQAPCTREEAAYWIGRLGGIDPVYDSAQGPIYSFRDWTGFTPERIPYCAAVIDSGIMSGREAGLFHPQAAISRGELAGALDRASRILLKKQGYRELSGTVIKVAEKISVGFSGQIQVASNGGYSFYVLVDGNREVFVYDRSRGVIGLSDSLRNGDVVTVLVNPLGEVAYIEKRPASETAVTGSLEWVDVLSGVIRASGNDGKTYQLALSPLCQVTLSGYPAAIKDLVPGMPVTMLVSGSQVSEVRGQLPDSLAGAATTPNRVFYGSLFAKSPTQITIRDDYGNPCTYYLTGGTEYFAQGTVTSYYNLKTGDYLKLTVDSQGNVLRVDVGKAPANMRIWRGRIEEVKPAFATIRFGNLAGYANRELVVQSPGTRTFKTAGSLEVYVGSKKGSMSELAGYRGRYAFFVTCLEGGEERVARVVVRGDSERRISGKVENADPYRDCFAVRYEPAVIQYDQATIAVKNDRLVDPDTVESGDMVTVFAERRDGSALVARVMVIDGQEQMRYKVGRGVLDEILSRSTVRIDSLDCLENHEWDYVGNNREYYYDSLTYIVLATASSADRLTAEAFYNRDEDLKDLDVLFIAEGDRIVAMLVADGVQFKEEIVTRGTVTSVDSQALSLKDVSSWVRLTETWTAESGELALKTTYAVVAKNGQGGDVSELTQGDKVYLLRAPVVGGERDGYYATAVLAE